ncbi:MAG: hypothetical protein WCO44_11775 [Bacteroidota bacterium]
MKSFVYACVLCLIAPLTGFTQSTSSPIKIGKDGKPYVEVPMEIIRGSNDIFLQFDLCKAQRDTLKNMLDICTRKNTTWAAVDTVNQAEIKSLRVSLSQMKGITSDQTVKIGQLNTEVTRQKKWMLALGCTTVAFGLTTLVLLFAR